MPSAEKKANVEKSLKTAPSLKKIATSGITKLITQTAEGIGNTGILFKTGQSLK